MIYKVGDTVPVVFVNASPNSLIAREEKGVLVSANWESCIVKINGEEKEINPNQIRSFSNFIDEITGLIK